VKREGENAQAKGKKQQIPPGSKSDRLLEKKKFVDYKKVQ